MVLPAHTENLNSPTAKLIEQFLAAGGRVLCAGDAPRFVDGSASERLQKASQHAGWQAVLEAQLPQTLLALSRDGFSIERRAGDQGLLFHHRRQLDDGQLLLLVNTSMDYSSTGTVRAQAQGISRWLPATGESSAHSFEQTDAGVTCSFELPPCGSLLLWLSNDAPNPRKCPPARKRRSQRPAKSRRSDSIPMCSLWISWI